MCTYFVVWPGAALLERFITALRSFALMSGLLTTALTTQWIHDGSAVRLLAGVRAEARVRQQLARQILGAVHPAGGDGIHAWRILPVYWNAQELTHIAKAEGVAVIQRMLFTALARR